MIVEHIGIWVKDLEETKRFYEKYFDAKSSDKYTNTVTGFSSYFLSFDEGCRIEIMTSKNVDSSKVLISAHISIGVKTIYDVLALTKSLKDDGYQVHREPRETGDGYFESVIIDPNGNKIEIVKIKKDFN